MTALIRAELLKLRSTRMPYALLGGAAASTALMTILRSSRAGKVAGVAPLNSAGGFTDVVTFTYFGFILALVFGVVVSSGEFRHATATPTYLATPNRARVLTAKAIAAAAVGVLFGLATAAVATGVGLAFDYARDYAVAVPAGTLVRWIAGAALGTGLLAAAGVALGSLVRNQVAAVAGVFAWIIVVEQLFNAIFPSAARYLPYTAATSLGRTTMANGNAPLPFWGAALLVAVFAALLSAVATRTVVAADVT